MSMNESFGEVGGLYQEQGRVTPESESKERGRNMEDENRLQMGWFTHRCQALDTEQSLTEKLEELAHDDPALAERITRSSLEERQTIVLENMINSPLGTLEAKWFRLHFSNDRSQALAPTYQIVLDRFQAGESLWAYEELDRLFRESMPTH